MSEKFPGQDFNLSKKNVEEIGADVIAEEEKKSREIVKEIMDQSRDVEDRGEIPLGKEITEMLNSLIRDRRFELVRSLDDEKGPFLRELTVEEEGGMIEYQYVRKGRHNSRLKSLSTNITLTFYDANGMPITGEVLARYEDGRWNLT